MNTTTNNKIVSQTYDRPKDIIDVQREIIDRTREVRDNSLSFYIFKRRRANGLRAVNPGIDVPDNFVLDILKEGN